MMCVHNGKKLKMCCHNLLLMGQNKTWNEREWNPSLEKKKKDSNGQYNMSKELPDLKYKRLSQRS